MAPGINGSHSQRPRASFGRSLPSHLSRFTATGADDVHDLICVGFGPASLAIAVALHDSQDPALRDHHGSIPFKVRFVERQKAFYWHAGMWVVPASDKIECGVERSDSN
jgi:hypothetical protein